MSEDKEFLKYLINEEVYVIPEESAIVEEPLISQVKEQKEELTGTVVMIDAESLSQVSDEHKELLKKILGAVDISLDQVAFKYNILTEDAILGWDTYSFNDVTILAFCREIPGYLTDYLPYYRIQELDGGKIVLAHSLSEVAEDKSKKVNLWNTLKSLYGI